MPHTRSAEKNLRKSTKRRAKNRTVKRNIKDELKSFTATLGGTVEAATIEMVKAVKHLDKAAAKKVIHPNMAARKKSQIVRAFNSKFVKPKA